jgi:RimJ/RimL family protein N-acetyltransferase
MSAVIETRRLVLRQPTHDDVPSIVHWIGDYAVARYLTQVPHPYVPAMAEEWLATLPAEPSPRNATFAVVLPGKGVIGVVSLDSMLGYWIAQPFWGQGFVTEAAAALLHWHFDNCDVVSANCGAHFDNKASLAVQRNLGFAETHREMKFAVAQNRDVEHIWTSVTRDAFKACGR